MDKISLEILENILKDCNKKLENNKLSSEQKALYLKSAMVISDIVLDDVESGK